MKQIAITIDPVGRAKIEAKNFQGQGCQSATEGLEKALGGGVVADRDLKPEYLAVEETNQQTLGY